MIASRVVGKFPQVFSKSLSLFRPQTRHLMRSAVLPSVVKSEYELEVEKFQIKDKKGYVNKGWSDKSEFEDDLLWKNYMFLMCTCIVGLGFPIMFYGPDWLNTFKFWRRREALMVLEKRLAAGKNPIDHDFAPAELIESMVPAAGQWEEDWLANQAVVRSPWVPSYAKRIMFD